MKVLKSFSLWLAALVIVIAVALVSAPSAPTQQTRITHLESVVKCPSCEDLSVAASNATSAVAVRHEIVAKVEAGQTDNQILTSLERVYGSSILLDPSDAGLGVVLWLSPVLALLALVAIGLRLWRRRR